MKARPGTQAALAERYAVRPHRSVRTRRACGVPGCGLLHRAHGLCAMHYSRRKQREAKGVFHADTCACAPCLATQRHWEETGEAIADSIRRVK